MLTMRVENDIMHWHARAGVKRNQPMATGAWHSSSPQLEEGSLANVEYVYYELAASRSAEYAQTAADAENEPSTLPHQFSLAEL